MNAQHASSNLLIAQYPRWHKILKHCDLRHHTKKVRVNAGLYHYAGNNPVRYIDPDGRAAWIIPIVIGITYIFNSCSNNKEIPQERKNDLMKSINQIRTPIAIINVPPNRNNPNYRDDPVEYNLFYENSNDKNLINVENNEEYAFVLSNLPKKITDIVVTGGHGSKDGKKLGKINVIQNLNLEGKKNFYFPDCYIGKNSSELQNAYGSENNIFAKKNKSKESDVANFLWKIHDNPYMGSDELQSNFYSIGEFE